MAAISGCFSKYSIAFSMEWSKASVSAFKKRTKLPVAAARPRLLAMEKPELLGWFNHFVSGNEDRHG